MLNNINTLRYIEKRIECKNALSCAWCSCCFNKPILQFKIKCVMTGTRKFIPKSDMILLIINIIFAIPNKCILSEINFGILWWKHILRNCVTFSWDWCFLPPDIFHTIVVHYSKSIGQSWIKSKSCDIFFGVLC